MAGETRYVLVMHRIASVVALAMMTTTACLAQSPEDALREEMISRFSKSVPKSTFAPIQDEPLVVMIRGGDLEGGQINLHRIFQFCKNSSKEDCETAKAEFIANLSQKAPELTRESLRLVVRDETYVDYVTSLWKEKSRPDQAILVRRIGDDLHALLASDSAETTAIVTREQLTKLGLSDDAAWQLARTQTLTRLPALPDPAKVRNQGVAFQDFDYLGSLLIDLSAWQKISNEVGPDLFVTAVSDNFVLVGTMPDGRNLRAFAKDVAKDCEQQQRCLSPNVYRFRNGRWEVAR